MKALIRSLLLFILLAGTSARASHHMGGEITWQCQANGQFVFTMKLYRDCNGIAGYYIAQSLQSNSPAGLIPMLFVDTNDVSPVCNASINEPHLFCAEADGDDTGSIEEYIYRSGPVTLNGVPPAGGWTFYWEDCCRNGAITNLAGASSQGYRLRAKMYAYNGRNTFPCFDSSPVLLEKPISVICTGYPTTFNSNAADGDMDSLGYNWDYPLDDGGGGNLTFSPNYSYDSPLPGTAQDTNNVPADLKSLNGEITFTSFTSGTFVLCNKVSEYRCGVLIGEIFRDIQIALKSCRPLIPSSIPPIYNNAPQVTPPFMNSLGQPVYVDTVFAEDTVLFSVNMVDFDLDPTGIFQALHLETSGWQYSSNYINDTACANPPCATISPNPLTTSGSAILNFSFSWITSCDHLQRDTSCQTYSKVHNFVFRALDDFCPVPGQTQFTVSIVVLPRPGSPGHPVIQVSGDTLYCSVTASSYQWYLNDTAIAGANAQFYVPGTAGNYSVEVLPAIGCADRSSSYPFVPVGIHELSWMLRATLSPNPFRESFRLTAVSLQSTSLDIVLRNVLGEAVLSRHLAIQRQVEEDFYLPGLPGGVYLLELKTPGARKTLRLVKVD